MREENYFKGKLQISKDNLVMAKSKLEHLDIQINLLKIRFDHDKKVYDDQAIHMQEIVSDMEKRIPELEKKIEKGYTTIDMKSGKAFKSFKARHVGLLQDKIKVAETRQKEAVERAKQKKSLKKKKRDRLSDKELDLVIAEEVREYAQPEDEIKSNLEKEKERLEAQAESYRQQLAELKATKKVEPEVKFDSVGNEVKKIIKANLPPIIKEPIEEKEKIREEIIDHLLEQKEVSLDTLIEEKKEIANEMRNVANLMNGETKELKWLTAKRADWIKQFELEEGGKAVWQGRVTNGFKQWCEAKGYKIGG